MNFGPSPGQSVPAGLGSGSLAIVGLSHRATRHVPGPLVSPAVGTDCFLPLFCVPGRPRNHLMSAEPARPLMGRKWAGASGTDEPGRRAPRRHSQG